MTGAYRNPVCGCPADDYTAAEPGRLPRAGSVGVCGYCGAVSIFTGMGLVQRAPTAAELQAALADPDIARVQAHFARRRR